MGFTPHGFSTFYIPSGEVILERLKATGHVILCKFERKAIYFNLQIRDLISKNAAWCCPEPQPGYEALTGCFSFYTSRVDGCTVGGKVAVPQAGGFFGGRITPDVVGLFKGDAGMMPW